MFPNIKRFHPAYALVVAALSTVAIPSARAADITFNSGTNIVSTTYDTVITTDNATTNFVDGAVVNDFAFGLNTSTMNISGGDFSGTNSGVIVYDTSSANISGGMLTFAASQNFSTLNISGGNIGGTSGGVLISDASTASITGGTVRVAVCDNTSIFNIRGGTLTNSVIGQGAGTINVSGGSIPLVQLTSPTATLNFIGTNFSYAYLGYNNSNDLFTVTGTIGSVENKSYNVIVSNSSGTPNSAQRQFNFVVIPEASSFALALPAVCCFATARLGIVGPVVIRRRKK